MANMAMKETMTRANATKLALALLALDEVSGAMLVATSGFNERSFLPAESMVFEAILDAKVAVSKASSAAFKLRALEATAVKK